MTEATLELIFQQNRKTHEQMSAIKEGQNLLNERLASIEHLLASQTVTDARQNMELDSIKTRLQMIENRLDLSDTEQ